jgi:SAM-dependent methyltransferase
MSSARSVARRVVPPRTLRWLRTRSARLRADPAVGDVDFGDLLRTTPIDARFGITRGGTGIDRVYIETFLREHRSDIRGRVLEVAEDRYTTALGGDNVSAVEILSLEEGRETTLVADLDKSGSLPHEAYDCCVVTQVLQFVRDPAAAVANLASSLRPGGVLLLTAPGISQISRFDADRWGDRWRFTTLGLVELLGDEFAKKTVVGYGNVLAAVAFLEGLVVDDLPPQTFAEADPDYELLVAARAVKR